MRMVCGVLVAERYRLDEPLGRGGMGEVWRAWDQVLGRPVAVKLLLPGVVDPSATARFRQEAQTAARLSHPNVVAVYDFGEDQGRLYLVMELVEGRTLAGHLAAYGPLDAGETAAIGAQTAAGLAAAHREGVVHRDVKPGNLLLTADGVVKIADFGIARFAGESTAALTSAGLVLGTSIYLAPERAQGHTAGPASDVYALGCVLYELLTGHPPFRADSAPALLYQHVDSAPVPPAQLRPDLPAALDDLVLQLLAKDPDQRPSAGQVAHVLGTTRPPGATQLMPTLAQPPLAPRRTERSSKRTGARRSRLPMGAAAIVVVAALVALGLSLSPSGPPAAASPGATSPTPSPATPSTAVSSPAAPSTAVSSPLHTASPSPARLSDNPAVLLSQLARGLRAAAARGDLAANVATELQSKISQAQASLKQGKTSEVRDRVHDINRQLAAAKQHHQFTSTPQLDQLLAHLVARVGATQ
jgi:eukaryotic-like serine/threonine-protein kinase